MHLSIFLKSIVALDLMILSTADISPSDDSQSTTPASNLQDCPQPRYLPKVISVLDDETNVAKHRLRLQRNFNKLTLWQLVLNINGVSSSSSSTGSTSTNFVLLTTLENNRRTNTIVDTANATVDVELEESIRLQSTWYAACGIYDYVVDSMKVHCSYCSMFKLCQKKPTEVASSEVEVKRPTPKPSSSRHSHNANQQPEQPSEYEVCRENVVGILRETIEYGRSHMLISFMVGDLPTTDSILNIKVTQPNLCIPERRVIFELDYPIYANTFVVVNITGLELGKIYALYYQPIGQQRFGTISRVHFRPEIQQFRMPTTSALCSVEGGEEIMANQLWPLDTTNRIGHHHQRPQFADRLF